MREVREGYKLTELGEIPDEWEVKSLGEIGQFSKGKGIPKKDLSEQGEECILYGQLYTTYSEVINDVKYATNVKIKNPVIGIKNDLLIPSSGETAIDIATASALNVDGVLIGGDINIFRPNTKVNSNYISYQINSIRKKELAKLAQGSSVYHLYGPSLEQFKVILPEIFEQQKIASILSIVDEQIDGTEQLIVKTKELKKGLMQQLLTKGIGHTEFKQTELGEIPVKWEVTEINNLVYKIVGGGTPSRDREDYYVGDIPWFTVKDMDGSFYKEKSQEYINELAIKESSSNLIESNKVIIATRIALGRGFINTKDIAINQDLKALYLIEEKVLPSYFLYWYLSRKEYIESMGSGSTVKGIRLEQLRKLQLPLPLINEQQKIASILSSVDEQIGVYKQEKAKYEELKKGLMQQLLTGKIRVKI